MGNGLFALALRSALLGRNAIITYGGEEEREGRSAAKYDFTISPFWRPFTISHQGATGTTGLQGSFWIDPVTLDVLRLESHATEIPPALFVTSASTTVNYARARIGSQEVLLPQSGEMYLGAINGEANRVAVEFANCRSYQAKSSVRFDDESAPLAAPPQPAARPTGKP
jgi:hypothetical protein